MAYLGQPAHNPFATAQPVYSKNYSEEFKEADYEGKTTVDIESYVRNLQGKLTEYLKEEIFPAALYDRLEKRQTGLISMLKKRYLASGVSTRNQARARLELQEEFLSTMGVTATPSPSDTFASSIEPTTPLKKRRLNAPCQDDVKKGLEEQRKFRRSNGYTGPAFSGVSQPEEEEN